VRREPPDEGPREAGIGGNCESTHEADDSAIDIPSNVEEVRREPPDEGPREAGIGGELRVDA
jgi:hypothetical protein